MPEQPLTDPILSELYRYWSSRRRDGLLPSRHDIDPSDIPRLLPHVMLLELHQPDLKLFVRLVGTKVATGQDPTGTYMEESVPDGAYGTHIIKLFRRAGRMTRPLYTEFQYSHPDESMPRLAKRLFLPLSEDGRTTSMLFIGQRVIAPDFSERSLWELNPDSIREMVIKELD